MPNISVVSKRFENGKADRSSAVFFRNDSHSVPRGLDDGWVPVTFHYPMSVGGNMDIELTTAEEVINFFFKNEIEITLEEAFGYVHA